MDDEQYINIEDGLSVGAVKYVDTSEIITEEDFNYIKNKVPELDERVGVVENEIKEINSSLDTKVSKDDFNIYNNYYNSRKKVAIPNEFNFSKQIDISKIAPMTYEVLKKPIDYFPLLTNKKIYYVSCTNGANTNDGLTTETPLKTIVKAMTMPDVGEIRIMGGMYNKDEASLNAQQNLTIKVVGLKEYGETYFTGSSSVTWTSYNSIWKCTRSNTKGCFDMDYTDVDNNYIPMNQKNSIEEVENTPHSYYFNSATNEVYLRTFNDRQPTNDKIHLVLQQSGVAKGNGTYYYENINFIFGNGVDVSIKNNSDVLTALFENCKFNYNLNGANNISLNGLNVNGAKFVYLNNCEASRNESDGFNYHDKLGITGEVIEVNCCGYENGYLLKDEIGNDNGSTSHENYKVVRINCDYRYNFGPNIADVNNARSCNIGVVASSTRTTTGVQADFQLEGDSYLINCYSDGKSKYSIAQTQENNVYVRDSVILGNIQKDLIDF